MPPIEVVQKSTLFIPTSIGPILHLMKYLKCDATPTMYIIHLLCQIVLHLHPLVYSFFHKLVY